MEYLKILDDMQSKACSCDRCKTTCLVSPCIPRPKEMHALIENGLKDRFSPTVWLNTHTLKTYVCIAPLGTNWEYNGHKLHKCTLLDKDGLCTLHDSGLKPIEGRVVICSEPDPKAILRTKICEEWSQEEGVRIIKKYYGEEIFKDKVILDEQIRKTISG